MNAELRGKEFWLKPRSSAKIRVRKSYGARFEPPQLLLEMAAQGRSF